ncbi:DUF4181 domain-containing protein [Priestia aryabhattai]|uniref:DUF4181 domain-containing protein n=1 Tax=Priestia aryabhattai TaxID=412384 RepID=UPI001C8E9DE5|nr:DUF4181 domain-containing protein [Priestia aryabhattai]MBY0028096.1 DUF4181 domain-containing protein [Priestia aryabhattai]HWL22507.1 DUF4181 domain-containing protein [Ureibacillus sp.]
MLKEKDALRNRSRYLQKKVNRWHSRIEVVLYIIFLFSLSYYNQVPLWIILAAFCIVYQGFNIFMEWKFARETKEHLLAVIFFFFYLASIGVGTLLNVF